MSEIERRLARMAELAVSLRRGETVVSVTRHVDLTLGLVAYMVAIEERVDTYRALRASAAYQTAKQRIGVLVGQLYQVVSRYAYWWISHTAAAARFRQRAVLADRLGCMLTGGCWSATIDRPEHYMVTHGDQNDPYTVTVDFNNCVALTPLATTVLQGSAVGTAIGLLVAYRARGAYTDLIDYPGGAADELDREPVWQGDNTASCTDVVTPNYHLDMLADYHTSTLPTPESLLATFGTLAGYLRKFPPANHYTAPLILSYANAHMWTRRVVPAGLLFAYVIERQTLWARVWLEPATVEFLTAYHAILVDWRGLLVREGGWYQHIDTTLRWCVPFLARYAAGKVGAAEMAYVATALNTARGGDNPLFFTCDADVATSPFPLSGSQWWLTRIVLLPEDNPAHPTILKALANTIAVLAAESCLPEGCAAGPWTIDNTDSGTVAAAAADDDGDDAYGPY